MERFNREDITKVDEIHEGTAAAFIGLNTKTGRKGIYKENGCMIGISNEDIREKLASEIIHAVGIDCADIDLVYDENSQQNACFSNYIIADDEKLVTPLVEHTNDSSENRIESYFNDYANGIKQLDSDENLIKACKKNYYNYTYMCCLIDCYDLKADNLPLVYNKSTGKYRPSPWFDFGTAFKPDSIQRQAFFTELSTDEVMENLFKDNYEDIKDIAAKVTFSLTPEKIDEIFNNDYVLKGLDKSEIDRMKARILGQIEKTRKLELLREQDGKEYPKRIKTFFKNIKDRFSLLFNKSKNNKSLTSGGDENKEKIAEQDYSSVADDKEAEMFNFLQSSKYPPEKVITYDQSHKETQGIDEQDLKIDGQ